MASVSVTLMLDGSASAPMAAPACVYGVVVGNSFLSPGVCVCDSDSSGPDCSSLVCPGNCNAPLAGSCDTKSGVCGCYSGFTGQDCGGVDGDCYVSYDGGCRLGYDYGEFVMNGDSFGANLNYGFGALPSKLTCEGGRGSNALGCSPVVQIQFCCRTK